MGGRITKRVEENAISAEKEGMEAEQSMEEGVEAVQGEAEKATTAVKEGLEYVQGKAEKAVKDGVEEANKADGYQDGQIAESSIRDCNNHSQTIQEQVQSFREEAVKKTTVVKEADRHQVEQIHDFNYLKHDLQTDLIHLYTALYLSTPLATATAVVDADILDIYVEPIMQSVNSWMTMPSKKTKNINLYKDIFVKESKTCTNIYVTGKAGMGKTSFCQKMISAWCTAHSNAPGDAILSDDQVKTMKDFEFLFYIPLKRAASEYHVEEMIKSMLLKTDLQRDVFTEVMQKESERCLIILDGLDEWNPTSTWECSYGVNEGLPDRNGMNRYTILTTSRPWKLEDLRLATSETDHEIEVSGIDDEAASKLNENLVQQLNARHGCSKTALDFEKELKSKHLYQFKKNPVMLKQLISLWYSEKGLGKSQCDVYSEIINLMLTQAEKQDKTLSNNVCRKSDIQLPDCFSEKSKCKECVPLLYSLSKLAFETLFNENGEKSLLFEQSVAETHGVDESDILTCFKVGILSQDIIPDLLTEKTVLSFLHKTFQEYLAALYIAMRAGDDKIMEHIFSICKTVPMLLELSRVVLFVSGMNPTVAEKMSPGIRNVMGHDGHIKQYRQEVEVEKGQIQNIQDMIIDCTKESLDNGHGDLNLPLDDINIDRYSDYSDRYLDTLQHQVAKNTANIKSININKDKCRSEARYFALLQHIVHCESLEKIALNGPLTNMSLDDFNKMLNLPSILALELDRSKFTDDQTSMLMTALGLSQKSVLRKLTNVLKIQKTDAMLGKLLSLKLSCITLTHDQICSLMTSLSQRPMLREIVLWMVECTDHDDQCRYQLNFSKNTQLRKLTLRELYVDQVTLKTALMTDCRISYLHFPGVAGSVLRCLPEAPNLQTLYCEGLQGSADIDTLLTVLPTLVHLRKVVLAGIDFSDRNVLLSPQMMNLKEVELQFVTLTDKAVCEFVDSIPHTQLSVTCWLFLRGEKCTRARDYIHTSPRFVVTRCDPGYLTAFNFQTKNSGE